MSNSNPYAAPLATDAVVQGAGREHLRKIASAQRNVNLAVLFYLALIPLNIVLSIVAAEVAWGAIVLGLAALAVLIFGAVSVYSLASLFHGPLGGVIYVLGLLVPVLGLILLVMLSSKATKILKSNGIKVGLLGANPQQIH